MTAHQVGIWAPDPITAAGVATAVPRCTGEQPLTGEDLHRADVVVVVADPDGSQARHVLAVLAATERTPVVWIHGEDDGNPDAVARHTVAAVLRREDVGREVFGTCLRQVLTTGSWTTSGGTATAARTGAQAVPAAELSARELEVLRLVAEGQDTTAIAGALFYSERTVKNVISRVVHQLQAANRAQAVAVAIRTGLV